MNATKRPLNPYEQWMVKSNLDRIRAEGLQPAEVAAQLRANGYPQIAEAVETEAAAQQARAATEAAEAARLAGLPTHPNVINARALLRGIGSCTLTGDAARLALWLGYVLAAINGEPTPYAPQASRPNTAAPSPLATIETASQLLAYDEDTSPEDLRANITQARAVLDAALRAETAAPDALAALRDVLRYCVTPQGLPDKGKGRTPEQQAALDAARAIVGD